MGIDVYTGVGTLLSLKVDHRTSGRIAARKNLSTVLELDEGDLLVGTVVDVSNRGLGLRLELPEKFHSQINELISVKGRLRIGSANEALLDQPCEIRHSAVDIHPNLERLAILGVALPENISVPIDQLEFRRDNEVIDLIEGSEAISEIVRDLVLIGNDAIVSIKAGGNIFRGIYRHDTKLKTISSLKVELLDDGACSVLTDRFTYTFFTEIYGSFYLFRTRIKKNEGKTIELVIPDNIVRVTRRLTKRVAPREGEDFIATFTDPFLGTVVAARIENFTERGLSAIVGDEGFTLPAGTLLPDLELQFASGPKVSVVGSVVHCQGNSDSSVTIGINIANNASSVLMPLFDFVVSRRYPDITDITPDRFEQNWELFDKAGYLEEKNPEDFKLMRPTSIETWSKLDSGKGEISRNFGIAGSNNLRGGVHLTRLFADSWIMHHLSILQGHQRNVTPQLFGGVCDYLLQVGAKHIVSYTNASLSWNEKNYYAFVKQINSHEDNILKTYELFEFQLGTNASEMDNNANVREANSYDLQRISNHFQEQLHKLQVEAFDLNRDSIEGGEFKDKYAKFGLTRDRKFIVYGSPGEIDAFAMCDIATDAVNIFSLLDKVELFIINESVDQREVRGALLEQAKRYFERCGKRVLLFLGNTTDTDIVKALNGQQICTLTMWLTTSKMIPRYKEYNGRLFGRILARVEKRTTTDSKTHI